MAYVFNGTERSLKFVVTKTVGGVVEISYPHLYNGQISWGNILYPTLTDKQFRELSDADYNARKTAFIAFVESIEDGLDVSVDQTNTPTQLNLVGCPPPPTTTTTTIAPTTTTTTAAATTTTTAAATTTTTAAATTTTTAAATTTTTAAATTTTTAAATTTTTSTP